MAGIKKYLIIIIFLVSAAGFAFLSNSQAMPWGAAGGGFRDASDTPTAFSGGPWRLEGLLRWLRQLLKIPSTTIKTVTVKEAAPPSLYKPVLEYEETVISVIEQSSPSVVSIIITKNLPVLEQCAVDPFSNLPSEFRRFFGADFFQITQPCVQDKTERREIGGGSGFIVDSKGLVVTNKHIVLDEKADYTVLTNDGKKYQARIVVTDRLQDLAVLKVEAPDLAPLTLGNSDEVKLGQTAIAIGNALGQFRNTVSVGVVSGLGRRVDASGPGITEVLEDVIQTDAAVNPGNSGGPLLNLRGEVIGINVATVAGAENISFSIPINQVKRAIESVKATGRIVAPYLGVRYLPVTEALAQRDALPVDYGALLRGTEEGPAVLPDSPAQRAGLQAEDIIFEVNGVKVADGNLSRFIQKHAVGARITLKVQRGTRELTLPIILEELK